MISTLGSFFILENIAIRFPGMMGDDAGNIDLTRDPTNITLRRFVGNDC